MKKKILTIAMLLCTTTVLATEVKKADKDADGTLDKSEVKAFKMLSKHFDIIDTDKDGTIDQAEINAHKVLMADIDTLKVSMSIDPINHRHFNFFFKWSRHRHRHINFFLPKVYRPTSTLDKVSMPTLDTLKVSMSTKF
jgi:hypothetical protein